MPNKLSANEPSDSALNDTQRCLQIGRPDRVRSYDHKRLASAAEMITTR